MGNDGGESDLDLRIVDRLRDLARRVPQRKPENRVFMLQGENSTIIQYELGNKGGSKSLSEKIELDLRPLIAFRNYHSTTRENRALNPIVESGPRLASTIRTLEELTKGKG